MLLLVPKVFHYNHWHANIITVSMALVAKIIINGRTTLFSVWRRKNPPFT